MHVKKIFAGIIFQIRITAFVAAPVEAVSSQVPRSSAGYRADIGASCFEPHAKASDAYDARAWPSSRSLPLEADDRFFQQHKPGIP